MSSELMEIEASDLRMGYVNVRGQRVRYADYGNVDAEETLLVFNGIGGNLGSIEKFMRTFENIRVVSFEAPGVGESPTPLVPYRMSKITRIATKILDTLGIGKVHVFGVSWGGAAAQQYALDYQKRCKSLTLAATSAGMMMVPGAPSVMMKMMTPKRHLDPEFMLNNGGLIYGGLARANAEMLFEFSEALHGATSFRGYLYQLAAISGWTSFHFLPAIKLPTLILMGEDDPIVPVVNGGILKWRLPNAKLKVLACGHLFMVTMPDETAHEVEHFIEANKD